MIVVGSVIEFRYTEDSGDRETWTEILIEAVTSAGFTFSFISEDDSLHEFSATQRRDGSWRVYGLGIELRVPEIGASRLLDELGVGWETWIEKTLYI